MFQYAPDTDCDPEQRAPSTPMGQVTYISRVGMGPNVQCNLEARFPDRAAGDYGDTEYMLSVPEINRQPRFCAAGADCSTACAARR